MAGYDDSKELIIEALMGRPPGTEVQPEAHQKYALNVLEYIRSLELVPNSTLIDIATSSTYPVQPNTARVSYIAGVPAGSEVQFDNFHDINGDPIVVSTDSTKGAIVILLWDTQSWDAAVFPTGIVNQIDGNIINNPDNEDLYSVVQEGAPVLKFKNRAYSSTLADYSGRGRVILRKNIVGGVNVLTAEMIGTNATNTSFFRNTDFIVQYDFNLSSWIRCGNGNKFICEGGSIHSDNGSFIVNEGGTSNSDNTFYTVDLTNANKAIQTNVFRMSYIKGTLANGGKSFMQSKTGWINVADYGILPDGNDYTAKLKALAGNANMCPPDSVLYFPRGNYLITDEITVASANVTIQGDSTGFDGESTLTVGDYVPTNQVYRGATALVFKPTFSGTGQEKIMFKTGANNFKINYNRLTMIADAWHVNITEDYANGPATGPKHRSKHQEDATLLANNNKISACFLYYGVMSNCNIYGFNGVGVYHGGYTAKIQHSRINYCHTGIKTYNPQTNQWITDSSLENVYISRCYIGIHASFWVFGYGVWMDEIETYGILQDQANSGGVTYDLKLEIVGGHFNHIDYAAVKAVNLNNTQLVVCMNRCGCYYAGYTYDEVPSGDRDKACQIFVTNDLELSQIHIKNTYARVGDVEATRGGYCVVFNILARNFLKSEIFIAGYNTSNRPYVLTGGASTETLFYWYGSKTNFVEGIPLKENAYGTTAERPSLGAFSGHVGYKYLDRDLNKLIIWTGTRWMEDDGATAGTLRYGDTASRPTAGNIYNGFSYYDTTLGYEITWSGASWRNPDGAAAGTPRNGSTAGRPLAANIYVGYQFFDTTLNEPIWYNGTSWVNATGTTV